MATTSLSLGKHWDDFLSAKVSEGRYGSKTEVVREALRRLEKQDVIDAEHVRLALEALDTSRPDVPLSAELFEDIKREGRKEVDGSTGADAA